MTPIPERDTAWNIPGATLDWKEQIKREGFEKQRIAVYNTRSPTCEPFEQGLRGPTVRIDRHALVLSYIYIYVYIYIYIYIYIYMYLYRAVYVYT